MSTLFESHRLPIILSALVFNLTLCYPQSIYIAYKLYINWNEMHFIKRRRFITLCLVASTVFFQLFTSQLVIWEELYFETYIIDIISTYAAHAITFAFVVLYITRMWCLHYDHQMYHLSNHKLWHSIINNTHFENNWYMKHRSTWGNDQWLLWRIGTPIFIACSLLHITLHIAMYGTIIKNLVTLLVVFCFNVIGARLWSQFPKIYDTILIRKELKLCVLIMMLSMIVYLAVEFTVGGFAIIFVPMASNMAVLHVLVLYPIHNVRTRASSSMDERDKDMAAYKSWLSFVNTGDDGCELKLHNYCTFMAFLAREFSIENLLFLTEYIQLKKYIIGTLNMVKIQANVQGYCDALCLPQCDEFPVSDIVKQYEAAQLTLDEETCFMNAVTSLYTKYIAQRTAMQEINISFCVRNAIRISIFGHNVRWSQQMKDEMIMATIQSDSTVSDGDLSKKMIHILKNFESAADEVSRLLTSSFSRFKYQIHYHSDTS